jgi:Putative peptidoglycan binding domain
MGPPRIECCLTSKRRAGMSLADSPSMSLRAAIVSFLMLPLLATAGTPFTAIHPEEQYPDPKGSVSWDPYNGLISRVQERLRALGFAAGPVNGDFSTKTQAALVQFQLSASIPASGQLDDQTLEELGVQRDADASAGATGQPAQQ